MNTRNAFLAVLAIAMIGAVVPPVIFGEPMTFADRTGGDPWRNFIYDFQTLIAGFFAVAAAWWTVAAMERTERADMDRVPLSGVAGFHSHR